MSYLKSISRAQTATLGSASYTHSGWRTVVFDSPSINTAGLTESSDVFTCTIPGLYAVAGTIFVTTNYSGRIASAIFKNGALVKKNGHETLGVDQAIGGISILGFVELEVGDTVNIAVYLSDTLNATLVAQYITHWELIS